MKVAELMMLRRDVPRSVHHCLWMVDLNMRELAEAYGTRGEADRLAGELHARLRYARIDQVFEIGLRQVPGRRARRHRHAVRRNRPPVPAGLSEHHAPLRPPRHALRLRSAVRPFDPRRAADAQAGQPASASCRGASTGRASARNGSTATATRSRPSRWRSSTTMSRSWCTASTNTAAPSSGCATPRCRRCRRRSGCATRAWRATTRASIR